jgi:hypothetical protein
MTTLMHKSEQTWEQQFHTTASPDDMPEDYYFSGMITFFPLEGYVEDICYSKSRKEFQIDSARS